MALFVDDCPRCGAEKITFDVFGAIPTGRGNNDWQKRFEVFCSCRRCRKSTVFSLEIYEYSMRDAFDDPKSFKSADVLNHALKSLGYMSLKNQIRISAPGDIPENIKLIFEEGATCSAVECWNAASTMFRLCLDLATKPLLPDEAEGVPGPNKKQRRDLGLRIPWLIEHKFLPEKLEHVAAAVREDGNDGAHAGNLTENDAQDLLDFTVLLLEGLYTEPARIAAAAKRRADRRKPPEE